jgi:ABC-2 type transport system permease protein
MRTALFIAWRDLLRISRQWPRLAGALVIPFIMLFLLGIGIGDAFEGGWPYVQFLVAGVIVNTIVQGTIISSTSLIWDREFGFLRITLLAPVKKIYIVLGKVLGGGVQSLVQSSFFLLFLPIVKLHLTAAQIMEVILFIFLVSIALSALTVAIASACKVYENFNAIILFFYHPLFFISSAYFPIARFPEPLRTIASLNPISYGVDAIRNVIVSESLSVRWVPDFTLATDLLVFLPFTVACFFLSALFFQRNE